MKTGRIQNKGLMRYQIMNRSGSRKATVPSEQNARKPWTQLGVESWSVDERSFFCVLLCPVNIAVSVMGSFGCPVGWTLRWSRG
ncbi:hypothetical protein RRG08_057416 [Elysia crispata]|uniref:Uncharacterized protein n=1 Tax=Elysia crispata TaxID=231223 RepID=A0AAE0Z9M6_9GAST|nr:hypothetical protein RRG08_057416 [Elysia crispata]